MSVGTKDKQDEMVTIRKDEYQDLCNVMEKYEEVVGPFRQAHDEPKSWIPEAKVPPFSGKPGGVLVMEFLARLNTVRQARQIPDLKFLKRFVPGYLEGEAFRWFVYHYEATKWS